MQYFFLVTDRPNPGLTSLEDRVRAAITLKMLERKLLKLIKIVLKMSKYPVNSAKKLQMF